MSSDRQAGRHEGMLPVADKAAFVDAVTAAVTDLLATRLHLCSMHVYAHMRARTKRSSPPVPPKHKQQHGARRHW